MLWTEASLTILWTEVSWAPWLPYASAATSERTLYLGYEGFLELDQEDALILGRDELWFPEFSIPTSEP